MTARDQSYHCRLLECWSFTLFTHARILLPRVVTWEGESRLRSLDWSEGYSCLWTPYTLRSWGSTRFIEQQHLVMSVRLVGHIPPFTSTCSNDSCCIYIPKPHAIGLQSQYVMINGIRSGGLCDCDSPLKLLCCWRQFLKLQPCDTNSPFSDIERWLFRHFHPRCNVCIFIVPPRFQHESQQ